MEQTDLEQHEYPHKKVRSRWDPCAPED